MPEVLSGRKITWGTVLILLTEPKRNYYIFFSFQLENKYADNIWEKYHQRDIYIIYMARPLVPITMDILYDSQYSSELCLILKLVL